MEDWNPGIEINAESSRRQESRWTNKICRVIFGYTIMKFRFHLWIWMNFCVKVLIYGFNSIVRIFEAIFWSVEGTQSY